MKRTRTMVPRNRLIQSRGNVPQKEIADLLGVTQQQISAYERGYSTPPPYLMKAMEELFSVPMEELFSDAFNPNLKLRKEA